MIVLRIDVSGHSADVRWAGAEAVVGSGASAAIQRDDAGWAPREAVMVHLGTEVLVVRGDGSGEHRLKPGDSLRLGRAEVTLVGLLPLAAESEVDDAPTHFATPETVADSAWRPTLVDDPDRLPAPDSVAAPAKARVDEEPVLSSPSISAAPLSPTPPPPPPSETVPAAPGPAEKSDARWRQGTFEDEIYAALKRTPWFALSAAIHAFVFALLLVLGATSRETPHETPRYGLLTAQTEMPDLPEESGGPKDRAEPDLPPEDYVAPDLDEPTPPESVPDAARVDPSDSTEVPEPRPIEAPPPVIGPSRSTIALRTKPKTKPAAPAKSAAPADDWVNQDTDRAGEVNQKAAARVRDEIKRGGGALGAALKGLKREDILVVRGNFDHMEAVLEELKIPYTLVSPYDLMQDYDFRRHKLVFWNCMDPEVSLPARYRPRVIAALRDFVRGGGFLFTTDWSISFLLVPAFPGFLETSGGLNPLPEMILPVLPTRLERENPLLEGVFPEGLRVLWWLETASQDVKVVRGAKVDVLIESRLLESPPKPRSPIVAATFAYGEGRVLHVMGHYYQQKGNVAGAAGAQRLALNFVQMRMEKGAPGGK